jgi:hypothetical protein
MTKDKLYHILNEKLFDIADLYKGHELEHSRPGPKPNWMPVISSAIKGIFTEQFDLEIWKLYLEEIGVIKFVRSGWFRENDMEDEIENLSFADLQGQKVDIEWIKENLTIIPDPLAQFHRVGIPNELATKALALGYFPDSPSIERMREASLGHSG